MAVGVLVGDILPIGGHKEALQGQEVVGVGELRPEQVVVVIGGVGLLPCDDYFALLEGGVVSGSYAVGIEQGVSRIRPGVLSGGLGGGIQGNTIGLVRFEGEADDGVTGGPPTGSQGEDIGVGDELSVIPGLAVVMGVVFPEDVASGPVEDIDLGAISGDSTGTG